MTGIDVSREDTITYVRLARPESGNALDIELTTALEEAVVRAQSDGTRVVVLTGDGPVFCGGGDVAAMSTAPDPSAYTFALASSLHRTLLSLAQSGLILIAAVHGAAAGAGFGIVLNADYVIASDKAKFVTAYTGLGVSPDGGTTHLLPRIVGHQRAAELTFAGRRLDANTAREWGIVNEVVPTSELTRRVAAVASSIAQTPAEALRATKRLISTSWVAGYEEHLSREAASISQLIATDDSRSLQHAFLSR